jgi:glycosyltransferase involved in cell wall biosynthesis
MSLERVYRFSVKGKTYQVLVGNQISESSLGKANETERIWILDLGQDHLIPKSYYLAQQLERFGVRTIFIAGDRMGLGQLNANKKQLQTIPLENRSWRDWARFLGALKRFRPRHVEILLDLRTWDLLFYVIVMKLLRIPFVARCRGSEIERWPYHRPHRKFVNRFALRSANLVLVRELYMSRFMVEYDICSLDKVLLFHNHVPIPDFDMSQKRSGVLFLNSLKSFRNPMRLIEIAKILRDQQIDCKFTIVGFSNGNISGYDVPRLERDFSCAVKENGLDSMFELIPFTNDPENFYKKAAIFILPTDFVCFNHSLLEAMSFGCVPIVEGGSGADLIIEDGKSGFICSDDIECFADCIVELFHSPDRLASMSLAARQKIIDEFDSERQAEQMMRLYMDYVWKGRPGGRRV